MEDKVANNNVPQTKVPQMQPLLKQTLPVPRRPIIFVPAKAGELLQIGPLTCRIVEDGSNTENRVGTTEFILPPNTQGPLPHWHEMHDETYLVTQGQVRFHASGGKTVNAKMGDYIVVPTRASHTFSNPFNDEARFFNTFTPAHYINYLKMLANLSAKGQFTEDAQVECMARYATLPTENGHASGKKANGK